MTGFAQLVLVLTSLAPIALVEAAVAFERHQKDLCICLILVATLLLGACILLLWGVARRVAEVPKEIKDPTAKEGEPLSFLVAYALPLVSAKAGEGSSWGLAAFALMMGLAIWQQQLFHINPLLAILGYNFFSVKLDDGGTVIVISRRKLLASGVRPMVRLSDYLWLDRSGVGGGASGLPDRDPKEPTTR